ncbi:S8 family serine peptidase [Kitasatospora sp. NPDC056783]|uniref:S8 family serine peptidase n=1 Tax=Kitasatospora sp. NPDC056783 TaxID=3345943 RepID=UPI0036A7093C
MRLPPVRRPAARIGLTLALLAASAALAATPAEGSPPAAGPPSTGPSASGRTASVLLELTTEAAGPAWRRAADGARRARRSPEDVHREAARAGAAQRARAGDALDRLAGAVHPIVNKRRDNAHSVPLTGAPRVWAADRTAGTGRGTRIGIIDSGIDYTHADFGGPGTEEAFRSVERGKPAPPALFPNAKVVGGRDLVGDDYDPDPASPHHQPVPHPSDNPIDCVRNGHGTHVAGTAAGYGVTADGRPYTGPYGPGLDPAAFRIGPGTAPGAQLYGIRVFGCEGSTDRVAEALDLAADPNGDGDLSDRLDVVNLSLGSHFGSTDDTDALAVDRLAELGTVVIAAAGNDGDVYAIGGSPGTAARAITVAASVHGHADVDGITVLAPAAAAGVVPVHWSERYQGWDTTEVSGELVLPVDQPDGCTDFSEADRQRLKGRIALLDWRTREADRPCNSGPRADHAADAGAIGALYAADSDHLAEIAGDDRIPAALLARADGERLRRAAAAGPVRVRLATPGNPLHGSVAQDQPGRADTLTDFTSRGIGVPGVVKPDLAAPGESIWSSLVGSGTGGQRESGTSMATPHVAGLAALVRAAHPDWTVEQVKAALMNTSVDTYLGDDRTGPVYGPERTGAGRVQVDRAVRTPAVAYAAGEGAVEGGVGVSFGPVEVAGPTALTREIEVRNTSGAPLGYRTSYAAATEVPGASYRVAPARVDVPAGGTARVRVTLSVPGRLGRAPDPTIDTVQGGRSRDYRGELSGRVLLTPVGDDGPPQLRVPVLAAPRPVGDLAATATVRTTRDGTLVALGGRAAPGEQSGLVSAFALGGEGARWPDCPPGTGGVAAGPGAGIRPKDTGEGTGEETDDEVCVEHPGERSADLRAAGAAVDSELLYVGVQSWAPATTPVGLYGVRVALDTDGDGSTDVILKADRQRGSDVLVSRALDARTGAELDVQPLNARWGDTDTGLLDSDVLVLPVRLSALPGVAPGHSTVRYGVWTGYAGGGTPDVTEALSAIGLTGTVPSVPLDVLHPALTVRAGLTGPAAVMAPAGPGSVLAVHRAEGDTSRLLLLHHLNPAERRAQVLDLP